MAPENDFTIGRHEAMLQSFADGQRQLIADVAEIKQTLAEQRGERRFMSGVWGVAGGSIVAVIIAAFKGVFHS